MMEVIKGRIVGMQENTEPKKEVELLTAPVPVRRHKLSFGAVVAVQVLLSVIAGGMLLFTDGKDEFAAAAEVLRRIING